MNIGDRYYIHSGENRGSIIRLVLKKEETENIQAYWHVWNETHKFEHTVTIADIKLKCNIMPGYRVVGKSQGRLR